MTPLLANVLLDEFKNGGPIMWPLLLVMLTGIFVIFERTLWWIKVSRSWDSPKLDQAIEALKKGDNAAAAGLAKDNENCPGLELVAEAVAHPRDIAASALQLAASKQLVHADKLIWLLGTVITLAPLFGLLGTVTGIMGSFAGLDGELAAAKVSGGISEALIATAFGLGIAIVAVIPFNIFRRRVVDLRHRLEYTANRIEVALALAERGRK